MFRTTKNRLSLSFAQTVLKNFSSATIFNTLPVVEPVSLAYNMYAGTDADNGTPPLVIMDDLFGSKKNWHNICKKLLKELMPRRRIITRNHGDSPHSPHHTYAHLAQDIVELLKQHGIDRVSVLGHSMGGRAMAYLALRYPYLLDRVIVVDITPINTAAAFSSTDYMLHLMKTIELSPELSEAEGRKKTAEVLFRALNSPATADFLLQNLKKLGNGNFAWKLNLKALELNVRNITRFPEDILNFKQFRGPVLLVGGSQSDFVRSSDVFRMERSFPNIKLNWIDSGHFVHFEKPDEFLSIVINFLNVYILSLI